MVCFGGFLFPFANNIRQYTHIIIRREAVLLFISTGKTAVPQLPLAPLKQSRYWLHESAAARCPIPGEYIDVETPKTLRAVIGIPISTNGDTAVPAHEILDTFLKSF